MDWQQLASLAIVFTAAALLLRGKFHRPKFRFARNNSCCGAPRAGNPPPSIIYRARKGERPTISIKHN